MKICGVVVWYNPGVEEVNNIKSYLNYLDKVIVVDNSENDNRYLLSQFNKIEYLPNLENLGIAKALNIGCYKALEDGYEYSMTMDQDSSFDEIILKSYIENVQIKKMQDQKIAIFAPITYDEDCFGYVEKVITSGNILSLKAFKDVNGFDDSLFIDEVDFDLCYKLLSKGYKIFKFEDIRLNHKLGNTLKFKLFNREITTMNHGHIRKYYIIRNRLVMRKRYPQYTKMYVKDIILDIVKIILGEEDKLRKLRYSIKGYIDYRKKRLGKISN